METNSHSKIVVVLGPGRTGTSLLMQILESLGMSVSEDLISERYHNPLGVYEDVEIATIYDRDIFSKYNSSRRVPFPWEKVEFNDPRVKVIENKLSNVLTKYKNQTSTIWGFKEPTTAILLPIWFPIFNKTKTVPIFILCVRNPATAVVSRRKSFDQEEAIGELLWLAGYVDALHYTGGDCFIVHYEDWFIEPVETGKGILSYTGLDKYFTGELADTLNTSIKPNLNRSAHEAYEVKNEYVKKLYSALEGCRGSDFDRAHLLSIVNECRQVMDGFKGWYLLVQQCIAQNNDLREKVKGKADMRSKMDELKSRVSKLENEALTQSQLKIKLQLLARQVDHLISFERHA